VSKLASSKYRSGRSKTCNRVLHASPTAFWHSPDLSLGAGCVALSSASVSRCHSRPPGEEPTVGRGVVRGAVAGARMKRTWTTCLWVGDASDKENADITNDCSSWDDEWMKHFGGVDGPAPRNGYHPAKFTPKQNPFYFALPYGE